MTVLSSMLSSEREDWLILDRVIERSVLQITLTWDGYKPGSLRDNPLCQNLSRALPVLAVGEVMWVTC
jgi:hypothetical protein